MKYKNIERFDGLLEINLVCKKEVLSTISYGIHSSPCGKHKYAVIDLIYTPEKHRCKGYGKDILQYLLCVLEKECINIVYLLVKSKSATGRFFKCNGFQTIDKYGCYKLMVYQAKSQQEHGKYEGKVRVGRYEVAYIGDTKREDKCLSDDKLRKIWSKCYC